MAAMGYDWQLGIRFTISSGGNLFILFLVYGMLVSSFPLSRKWCQLSHIDITYGACLDLC